MSVKNLVFVLTCHQCYIRHGEDEKRYAAENNLFFSSISNTYLPLLRMLHRLVAAEKRFKLSFVISPTLCALLSDTLVQQQYVAWLDRHILLGRQEIARCAGGDCYAAAQRCLERYLQDKKDFTETYGQNLLRGFARFAKKGFIELLATAGTYAFLPHYADMTEVLNAQVETGLCSHRYFFGSKPDGFWLPALGYAPGVEKVLRAYGLHYTFVDTHAVLFPKVAATDGIFSPVRCQNSLVLFARDRETPADFFGENGFSHNSVYSDQNKDIGFELPSSELGEFVQAGEVRLATGFRYWAKSSSVYDAEAAAQQVRADAKAFVAAKLSKLTAASELLNGKEVTLVCTIPADELTTHWAEGVAFLEAVIDEVCATEALTLTSGASLLSQQFSLQKLTPYPSAATGSGYGEDLLDNTNGWMLRYTRKMCERMIDISGRFPNETGLKVRLLNLGAKELMLAQSSEWAKMLHEGQLQDYVTERFKASIQAFITVFDSLGSNTVSTEWLTRLEREHPLFPWMNFRIFSRKK